MADEKNAKDKNERHEGFQGVPKEDMDVLKKAAAMYERLTGESVKAVGMIPTAPAEEKDPDAIAKLAETQLEAQAKVTKATEEAQQAERKLQQAQNAGLGDVKDLAHPEPILAPIAAKQQESVAAFKSKKGEPPKREAEPKAVSARVSG
jgi:hypothetical protein